MIPCWNENDVPPRYQGFLIVVLFCGAAFEAAYYRSLVSEMEKYYVRFGTQPTGQSQSLCIAMQFRCLDLSSNYITRIYHILYRAWH